MKNVKKINQKTCLCVTPEEFRQAVLNVTDGKLNIMYDENGQAYGTSGKDDVEFVDELLSDITKLYDKLAEYFDVGQVITFHTESHEGDGTLLWIVYEGKSYTQNTTNESQGEAKNTMIKYLYRDGANYKRQQRVIIAGQMTPEQVCKILDSCDGECFIPEQVGLSCDRFEEYGHNETDHCWCELYEDDFRLTNEAPTDPRTPEELVQAFADAKDHWDDVKYAI